MTDCFFRFNIIIIRFFHLYLVSGHLQNSNNKIKYKTHTEFDTREFYQKISKGLKDD